MEIRGEVIRTYRGLIQGSVISPILFNLFINDLLLRYEREKIQARAYADDIACICISIEQARKAIIIMKEWWETNKVKINETKSGLLGILKNSGKISIIINAMNIPEVNSYKYLGVIINQSLIIENQKKLIQSKILTLKRIGLLKPSVVDLRSRHLVYKTLIYQKLCYASNIFLNNNLREQ